MSETGLPSFAGDYPDDPELRDIARAYERGDFRGVRAEGAKLLSKNPSPEVAAAARDLVSRTKPDTLSVAIVAMTALLLLALSSYWMLHDGPQ